MGIDIQYKQKIISLVAALYPQIKIYLFGSQAAGTAVHGSDIDIALDMGVRMKRSDVGEVREILNATDIPHQIDVVDFHGVSDAMQAMIVKERIVWKS